MNKLIKTNMMVRYLVKFAIRIAIFIAVLILYSTDKELMYRLIMQPIYMGITPMHLLWLLFMGMMILHIFPMEKVTMALLKTEKKRFVPQENYSEIELFRFVKDQNARAWKVMLLWLSFNAVFGILYLFDIIGVEDLLMLSVFYFLCDYICILIFCPFQTFIMKNKCCINCRIYDWGHFMMFTPMLFIQNFYSWSLFFTACIVLIKWEIIYAKHPERFCEGSNKNLQCQNCKDRTCQIKKNVTHT